MFYFFLNKAYRQGLILTIIFGVFLYFIDSTSAQLISVFSGEEFSYFEKAFFKGVYVVLLVAIIALLIALNKNEKLPDAVKGKAFNSFVFVCVLSFFTGWVIHLYTLLDALQSSESIMAIENSIWLYHAQDFTLVIGFLIAGFTVLKPAIHNGE